MTKGNLLGFVRGDRTRPVLKLLRGWGTNLWVLVGQAVIKELQRVSAEISEGKGRKELSPAVIRAYPYMNLGGHLRGVRLPLRGSKGG